MIRKFEAHVTMSKDDAALVERAAVNYSNRKGELWAYSAIDGDPLLGKNIWCYLTTHDADGKVLFDRMNVLCKYLDAVGIKVLRRKVEEILFDSKTGHDVMAGMK